MKKTLINVVAILVSFWVLAIGFGSFWFINFACGIEDTNDCYDPSHVARLWFWRAVIIFITFALIFAIYRLAKWLKRYEKRTSR